MDIRDLIDQYQKPVLTIAYRMLGNWEDARDAAQDAFIRCWQSRSRPQEPDALFSYLARIVTNRCIDQLRRKKRISFQGLRSDAGFQHEQNAERSEANDMQELILKTASRLKPKQKAVFVLRDIEQYSVRETAAMLGESENKVRVNLHLARKNLRKWLEPVLRRE